jgi:hypothetical protein
MHLNNIRHRLPIARILVGIGATTLGLLVLRPALNVEAHKAVTSRYTYNDHVFPILRDKCGRCHVEGGPAPMSLLSYKENAGGAAAWAESIREMLVFEAMPPWYVDPAGPPVRNTHAITAREIDVLVTWAAGGTPEGDLTRKPAPVALSDRWSFGQPDATVQMEQEHTIPAGVQEETKDFTLATNLSETKWIRAVDLRPGAPSAVRQAMIGIEKGPVLAVWEPGDEVTPAPSGTAFRLPAGAKLNLRVRYKKSWRDEQKEVADRSTVGLYFTDEPLSGREIQGFAVNGPTPGNETPDARTFAGSMTGAGRVLGVRPLLDQPYTVVDVQALLQNGRRVPLLKLRSARPEWPRRYWLTDPIELPAGTKIEVSATPAPADEGPLAPPVKYPLQVALDLVPQ